MDEFTHTIIYITESKSLEELYGYIEKEIRLRWEERFEATKLADYNRRLQRVVKKLFKGTLKELLIKAIDEKKLNIDIIVGPRSTLWLVPPGAWDVKLTTASELSMEEGAELSYSDIMRNTQQQYFGETWI